MLNAASAIFLAQRDRVPMVVTATQAESFALGADHRAEISDIVASVRPITKWAWMPPTPERVPEALRRAHSSPPRRPAVRPSWRSRSTTGTARSIMCHRPAWRSRRRVIVDSSGAEPALGLLLGRRPPMLVVGYEAVVAACRSCCRRSSLGLAARSSPSPSRRACRRRLSHHFGGSFAEAAELAETCDLVVHFGVNTYEAFHRQIFARASPSARLDRERPT